MSLDHLQSVLRWVLALTLSVYCAGCRPPSWALSVIHAKRCEFQPTPATEIHTTTFLPLLEVQIAGMPFPSSSSGSAISDLYRC